MRYFYIKVRFVYILEVENMNVVELPIGEMVPRVLLARHFDASRAITINKKPRQAKKYELSFYIQDRLPINGSRQCG